MNPALQLILSLCLVAAASAMFNWSSLGKDQDLRNDYGYIRNGRHGGYGLGYGPGYAPGYAPRYGSPRLRYDNGYVGAGHVTNYAGYYRGQYYNACPYDGIFLSGADSFVQCDNGYAVHTSCAPGSRNAESYEMNSYGTFCGVNLVDNQLDTDVPTH